jgi:hypothetical protein
MRFVPHHKPGARRYDLFMANSFIGKIMAKVVGGLDALRVKQSSLASQRDTAHSLLVKARAALQVYLLGDNDGDDRAVAALQAKVDAALSLLASLDTAIKTQGERVADAERQLADEQTKAARKMASEALALDVNSIESQLKPWLAATRQLAIALEKYGPFRFECGSISSFLGNAANEVEIAMGVSLPDLRGGVVAVAEGRERAPAKPGAVVKTIAPPAPTTARVYLTASVAWYDEKGAKYRAPAMNDCDLPLALIAKGKGIGAVHELKSDVRRKSHGSRAPTVPAWEHCRWLNDNPLAKTDVEPILSSHFQPHPGVGKPYTIRQQQPVVPVTATRTLPTDK